MALSWPEARIVETKSPKPSIEAQAASSKGLTKKADATCARWCSTAWTLKWTSEDGTPSREQSSSSMDFTFETALKRSLTFGRMRGPALMAKMILSIKRSEGSRLTAT